MVYWCVLLFSDVLVCTGVYYCLLVCMVCTVYYCVLCVLLCTVCIMLIANVYCVLQCSGVVV